jgi:hypothetical protein
VSFALEVALDHLGGGKILNGKIARPNHVHFEFQFSRGSKIFFLLAPSSIGFFYCGEDYLWKCH